MKRKLLMLSFAFAAVLSAAEAEKVATPQAVPATPAAPAVQVEKTVGAAPKVAQAKVMLTLAEAKRLVLEKNPTLAQARAAVDAAVAAVTQARASYMPKLDATGRWTRVRDQYGHDLISTSNPRGRMDPFSNYTAGFAAELTIFDGFQRWFQYKYAKYGESSSREAELDARRQLLQAVAQSYFAVLLARDNMNIAKEDADFNMILLDDAKKRHEGGVAKQSEVLNFVLRVQQAGVDYINAEQDWKVALVALGALLTIDKDDLWLFYELEYPKTFGEVKMTVPQMIEYARTHRPDLRAIDQKIDITRKQITAARGEWLPSVYAFGNYQFDRDDNAHFNKSMDRAIQYGIGVTWNLFNGGRSVGRLAEAKARLVQSIAERESTVLDIDAEIRQTYLRFLSSKDEYAKQEVVYATAKQIRDLVHQEYIGGTTTITRLNEAQTDMNNAANSKSAAFIQILVSLDTLQAATAENLQIQAEIEQKAAEAKKAAEQKAAKSAK